MEDEVPSRCSVAELAGRFKGSAPPHDAAGPQTQTERPVRRRPPRSLQLPKAQGDEQELPGVTSPLPVTVKRNSALIEKLQANLALSPSTLLPSPKSPGFRLLPPAFPPSSPTSAPVSTVTSASTPTPTSPVVTLLTEEEGPASFEAPPTVGEGLTLSNTSIKGRARHSIRRRPPSRRHRKSSTGDEVSVTNKGGDTSQSSPSEDGRGREEGGGGEGEGGAGEGGAGEGEGEGGAGGGEGGVGEGGAGGGGEGGAGEGEGGAGEGGAGGGEGGAGEGEGGAGGGEGGEGEGGAGGGEEGEGGAGGGEVVRQKGQLDELKDEASSYPEKHEGAQLESREEDRKKKRVEESSSGKKEEEITEKLEEDLTEGATDSKEEEKMKDGVQSEASASSSMC